MFLDLGRLWMECVVITAQELSMRWASDFSFRSFSSRYLAHRFNLAHSTNGFHLGFLRATIHGVICICSLLPNLLGDLLSCVLQNGGRRFDNLALAKQLSVHVIMRPLWREMFRSAQPQHREI